MSILIEGMEMPKKGSWISLRVFPDGQCVLHSWCGNDDEIKFEFMEHLTAVPVPPHGRLGDLDELAKRIEHERFNHMHTDGLAARHHVTEYGHFLNAISKAPTIIQADPPKGET